MLYSCSRKYGNEEQMSLVREHCEGKEKCRIEVSRQFFGESECPGTDAGGMSLWLIYSCDGGSDLSNTHNPRCDRDGSSATTGGSCNLKNAPGKKHKLDVPGCGGRIDLHCDGGCIRINKVGAIIHFYLHRLASSGALMVEAVWDWSHPSITFMFECSNLFYVKQALTKQSQTS